LNEPIHDYFDNNVALVFRFDIAAVPGRCALLFVVARLQTRMLQNRADLRPSSECTVHIALRLSRMLGREHGNGCQWRFLEQYYDADGRKSPLVATSLLSEVRYHAGEDSDI